MLRDAGGGDACLEELDADPVEYVRTWLKRERTAPLPDRLRFGGGLVGYFGYEAARHIEPRALGPDKPDALGTPDVLLLVSDELAVVDNVLGKLYLVVYADPRQPQAFARACERLEGLRHRLASPLPGALGLAHPAIQPPASATPQRTFTQGAFLQPRRPRQDYILAGALVQGPDSPRSSRTF